MPHRSVTPRSADAPALRARLVDVDVDRTKRIDDTIDYFGEGRTRRSAVTSDPRGESPADEPGAQ